MYRNCIFCSAGLGSNDSIERFPVSRSMAFDGEKGRLWAVCGTCARWNLAPIAERWEAVEDAERLFRDTRMRVQSENVGLAKLADGTRLIRVGAALPVELAAWRYGREMRRRRLRAGVGQALGFAGAGAMVAGTILAAPLVLLALPMQAVGTFYSEIDKHRRADRVAHRIPAQDSPTGQAVYLRWRDLRLVRTGVGEGGELELRVIQGRGMWAGSSPVVLTGGTAAAVMGKALAQINGSGARKLWLDWAMDRVTRAGGAEIFLRQTFAAGFGLEVPGLEYGELFPTFAPSPRKVAAQMREQRVLPSRSLWRTDRGAALALEMALNHETERRALEGELAALEAMWRQAEEIASIADALPDLPAPEPPRIAG